MASRAGPSHSNQPKTRHRHPNNNSALPPTTPDRRQAASELLMKDDLSAEAVRFLRSAGHRKKRRFLERDSTRSSEDQLDLIASPPRRSPVHTRWPDSHSEDQLALSESEPGPSTSVYQERAFIREGTSAPSQGLTHHSDPPPPSFLDEYERYRFSLKGIFTEDEPQLKASYYGEVNNSPHLDYGERYSPRGDVLFSPSSSSRSTSCTPPQCYSPLALPLADHVCKEPGPTLPAPAVPPELLHVEEQLQARRQALYDKMPW